MNPFGIDFASENYEWTVSLCQTDSDGDGRTNGEELGDPTCVWFAGGPEPTGPSLSHPGVIDEPRETPPEDSCASYTEPSSVVPVDIVFSAPSAMDETQTHYICEQKVMDVPSSEILHIIKTEVLLDNPAVLHHMFVFLCPEGSSDGDRVGDGNYECSGQESRCTRIGAWAIGPHETCYPENVGAEVDFSNMENMVVKIEAHYDNTSGQSQEDQSGIRVTMTPELRPLKSTTTTMGFALSDPDFAIPPQSPSHALTNICPSEATIKLPHPIYFYSFYPHMHLYGRSLYTEHYRCGKKIGEIGRINDYEFNNQQQYLLPSPIKVLPGDFLKTTCVYDSTGVNETITGGEETTDEMCINFLSFYPSIQNPDGSESGFGVCLVFENGIREIPDNVESPVMLPEGFRFGIIDRAPTMDSLLLSFDSDPANSWAPCCETDSCDETFLANEGGVCAQDGDCVDGTLCDGGFCVVPIASTTSSAPMSPPPTSAPTSPPEIGVDDPVSQAVPVPRVVVSCVLAAIAMWLV